MASEFFPAWQAAEPRALALLDDACRRQADRAARAAAAARPVSRALHAALLAQDGALPPSPARSRNLARLAEPGALAVVTGQQMGLLLGPLFTAYKALSAVSAAKALEAETGRPCVPIFWLQDEDHDLAEVNHTFVPTPSGVPLRLAVLEEGASAWRAPLSHCALGGDLAHVHAALRAQLGREPHAEEHLGLLERAYVPGATLSQAFARAAAEVFAPDGLVFLDPRDPAIAALAAPFHRRALEEAPRLAGLLEARSAALAAAGFSDQVHVRPGAPLAFFSPDGAGGPRYRLEPRGADAWALVGHPSGATVSRAALLTALETEPLRFSTSALLRPLLQDTLLPTAAYVGGPAEVAYFAQLLPLYAALGLPAPLVVPRARFTVLDDRTRGLLEKLGLSAAEAAGDREAVLAKLAARQGAPTPAQVEARLWAALGPELQSFGERLRELDPSLGEPLQKTEDTIRAALGKLLGRYGKALGQKDQVAATRLDRVRGYLLPNAAPQERVFALAYFACRFGTQGFLDLARAGVVPFSGALQELSP